MKKLILTLFLTLAFANSQDVHPYYHSWCEAHPFESACVDGALGGDYDFETERKQEEYDEYADEYHDDPRETPEEDIEDPRTEDSI